MNQFKLLSGIFAAASFACLTAFTTIAAPLPTSLGHAAFCFSVALIPLSVQSLIRWPATSETKIWLPHGWVFLASSILFIAGILYLISYFGRDAVICTVIAVLATVLCIGFQLLWERRRKK
jgi:hypothetical protein